MVKKQEDSVQEETSLEDVVQPAEDIVSEEEEVAPPEPPWKAELDAMRGELDKRIEERDKHWQSVVDRRVRQADDQTTQWQRQAQSAQAELEFLKQTQGVDPEELRVRKLEHELLQLKQERESASIPPHHRLPPEARALIRFHKIDPKDSRIDYATDTTSYDEGMDRLEKSLERIKAEERVKKEEEVKASMEEAKERLKADQGLVKTPKVDTQGASGGKMSFEELGEAYSKDRDKYREEYAKAREERGY